MVLAFELSACTSLRPVEFSDARELAHELEEGARIVIVTSDDEREELRLRTIGENYLEGTTRDGRRIRIAFADIKHVDRRAVSAGKTAALAGGLAVLYVFVVVGVAVHAIVSGF